MNSIKCLLVFSVVLWTVYQDILVKLNDIATKRPLPENVKDVYDAKEYEKFLNYRNDNKKLSTVKSVCTTLFTLIFLVSNLYATVYNALPGNMVVKTLLLMLIFETFSAVVSIPFGYYDTFVIEERYGMNKSTKKTFITDQIKQYILSLVVTSFIIGVAMLLIENFGNTGILFMMVVIVVLVIMLNMLSMKFMRIFNKFTPLEEGELRDKLMGLCTKYGVQVKEISVMDASRRTTRANAFCAGIGKKKDISLDDNLVNRYSTGQIVAVFAHEFGHAKLKHVPKQMLISILQLMVYVAAIGGILNIPALFTAFGFEGVNYYFVFSLFEMIAWPVLTLFGLVLNYFSRKCEYEADAFAAKQGYGEELISSLKQLSRDSLSNLNPHPVIVALEYSHPTISQRATAIERVKIEE